MHLRWLIFVLDSERKGMYVGLHRNCYECVSILSCRLVTVKCCSVTRGKSPALVSSWCLLLLFPCYLAFSDLFLFQFLHFLFSDSESSHLHDVHNIWHIPFFGEGSKCS